MYCQYNPSRFILLPGHFFHGAARILTRAGVKISLPYLPCVSERVLYAPTREKLDDY